MSVTSKYCKSIEIKPDLYAVYNSLLFYPIFCKGEELRQIHSHSVDAATEKILLGKKIYVHSVEEDDRAMGCLISNVLQHKRKLNILYLIVSTACNLACKYCFIEQNPNTVTCAARMTKETAKKAIDDFYAVLEGTEAEKPQIVVYGGEPMTNRELLPFIFQYVREISPNTKLTMISNATLIDDQMIDLICKYDVGVGISIDGPKDINDKNRVFASGNGSVYDSVTATIKKLLAKNAPFGLSITVTQDVLNNQDRVIEWIKTLGVKDIFWNLFHFSEYADNWAEYYREMSDFIFRANDELMMDGIADGRVMELLDLFERDSFRYQSCGAVGINQLAVAPDGSVFICHGDNRDPRYNLGNISQGMTALLHSEGTKQWDNLLTIDHEECRNCEAFFVCGGGCPSHANVLFGSRQMIDKSACIFYKKYLVWLLEKYYDQTMANNKTISEPEH